MRVTIATLITIAALTGTAHAQRPPAYVIPSVPAPRDPLPRFTIAPRGGALGPIGLPLPQIGLQPLPPQVQHDNAPRGGRRYYGWPTFVFYVSEPSTPAAPSPAPAAPPADTQSPPGRLILDVQPVTAQVFADGYYIGMPADFSSAQGGGLIEAGAHRIDVSAPGYEPFAMDLRVTPGRSVTVQARLKAFPPAKPIPATTFYLIPGCYMGNIPPKDAHLPASCDQSRAITWNP